MEVIRLRLDGVYSGNPMNLTVQKEVIVPPGGCFVTTAIYE
jgi:hypothetical protein